MARALSETLINMIVKLYEEGMPITHIAEELRLDKVTVHKYLKKTGVKGVDPEYSQKSASRLTDTQKIKIINLYKSGVSVGDIMEQVGCSAPTLYTYLHKEGLSRKLNEEQVERAVYLYTKQKRKVADIAEETGLSTATIYRKIKEYKEQQRG